jgi:hypothetical protein
MKNVAMKVVGTKLTIEIDLAKSFGDSKSGKSIVIATTGGNVVTSDGVTKIGLNVYRGKEQ